MTDQQTPAASSDAPAAQPARRERVLSGMQPTSDSLHLGNYLGALTNWVHLQDSFDAFFFVADLHALDVNPDPKVLRQRTRITAAQFIAGGVDPERSPVFVQSHVPEHTQLMWVLACLTGYGEATRMTQFKDKVAKGDPANLALLNYPVLMAADILLYDAAYVPVGEDQRQHLELTRDLAQRFNGRYKKALRVPEPYIVKESGAKIMDLQDPTAKMSKSAATENGLINLLDDPKASAKKIKSAVTDSDTVVRFDVENKPGVSNLLTINSVLSGRSIAELEAFFEGKQYGHLKVDTADVLVEAITPFRTRTLELLDDPAELDRILARGAERASEVAQRTLARVYDKVGLLAPVRPVLL